MTDNPINDIEDQNTWIDFGRQGFFILKGAFSEGATVFEATTILTSFYAGIMRGSLPEDNKDA
jgi:hypothetical protein